MLALLTPGYSDRTFRIGLYLEHLEEASFLYEQRRDVLLDDPELTWLDLADSEDRSEAHLDALVLGEDLALAVCQQQIEEGDAGELYAALCAFCRQRRKDLLDEALDGIEAGDEERVRAVCDALAAELPEAWERDVVEGLGHSDEWQQDVAAYVTGHRRLSASEPLLHALPEAASEAVPALLRALGRTGDPHARAAVWKYLNHERAAVREEAALALLRLGGPQVVRRLAADMTAPWAMLLLGISGGAEHRVPMQEHLVAGGPSPEGLLALGFLGDPQSVDGLIYYLQDPALAEASALGLHLLTGAALYEEVFVPEEMDEEELFEDEVEASRRGELPRRPDGEPYGETVERLSQSPEVWRAWWEAHGGRFQPGVRYRLGEPCAPMSLVRTLQAERMPRPVRQLAYEELVIRYTIDASFETDLPVRKQRRAIEDLERQAAWRGRDVRPGHWYFAGQIVSR